MKILIYGAGVIGCTYGWQLWEARHDITVLVHEGQKQCIEENGIHIICRDFREGRKGTADVVFRPNVIEKLSADNDFEYIIVAVNKMKLPSVLPILSVYAGNAHVLFFQNNWDCFGDIDRYLKPGQYFFGFPFMAGGGKNSNCIRCTISGMKYSHTPIGEVNGEITPRVMKIAEALEEARLKPVIQKRILLWIITHYAVAAGLSAGILSAGNAADFVNNPSIVRMAIRAIREGFAVCYRRGYDAKAEKGNKLYLLPLFISVPIARRIYSNESLQLMFDGHINHAKDEILAMTEDIIKSGTEYAIPVPGIIALRNSIAEHTS